MDYSNILETLEQYSIIIGKTSYPPLLFIWVLFFLFLVFLVRIFIFIRADRKYKREGNKWLLIGQQSLCYLFSIIISFTLTCIFENNSNYILNCFICPIIGFISSLVFENKVLSQTSENYGLSFHNNKSNTNTINSTSNLISNNNEEPTTNNNDNINHKKFLDFIRKPGENDYLSDDDIKSDDHNFFIKNKINKLIESRYVLSNEILSINKELKNQTDMLEAMRETMKDDKKIKLEIMIYECLNQGYAKPEQNKIITTDYSNYRALHGNGEIKELYENHYLKLQVHEDRRKSNRNNETSYNDNITQISQQTETHVKPSFPAYYYSSQSNSQDYKPVFNNPFDNSRNTDGYGVIYTRIDNKDE